MRSRKQAACGRAGSCDPTPSSPHLSSGRDLWSPAQLTFFGARSMSRSSYTFISSLILAIYRLILCPVDSQCWALNVLSYQAEMGTDASSVAFGGMSMTNGATMKKLSWNHLFGTWIRRQAQARHDRGHTQFTGAVRVTANSIDFQDTVPVPNCFSLNQ